MNLKLFFLTSRSRPTNYDTCSFSRRNVCHHKMRSPTYHISLYLTSTYICHEIRIFINIILCPHLIFYLLHLTLHVINTLPIQYWFLLHPKILPFLYLLAMGANLPLWRHHIPSADQTWNHDQIMPWKHQRREREQVFFQSESCWWIFKHHFENWNCTIFPLFPPPWIGFAIPSG